MPKNVDIVYFIEHAARELDIACAIKVFLEAKYSMNVEIASYNEAIHYIHSVDFFPKVVVLPFAITTTNKQLNCILSSWPGARYVNLSMEQLLGKAQKGYKAPKDEFALRYVLHSVWGKFFADYLMEHGVLECNLAYNGSPTLMLYQEPYKQFYFMNKDEIAQLYDLDPSKKWLFIPENYGWAFFTNRFLRARIKRGFDREDAYEYRRYAHESLRQASQWWNRLAQERAVEIIVRPRPAIPAASFSEKVSSFVGDIAPNIHFIKARSVREWILISDIVMSSYSTTLIEAAVAQKPVFMLVPEEIPDFLFAEWYPFCPQVCTYSDFETAVFATQTDEKVWTDLKGWAVDNMLSYGDAFINLTEMLYSLVLGEIELSPPTSIVENRDWEVIHTQKFSLNKLGWKLYLKMLNAIGLQAKELTWNAHESDTTIRIDAIEKVNQWQEVLSNNKLI